VARTGNMCSGNSSTVAWWYFCRNWNPFSQTGGSSSSAWPWSVPYANSDNSWSRKCNSSNRTTYWTEFWTYVMVR
jgi:hypothetical protein